MDNPFGDAAVVEDSPTMSPFGDMAATTAQEAGAPGFGGALGIRRPGTARGIAEALDISEQNIDIEQGAAFLDRLDSSFSETDEEIQAKFSAKYPKGKIRRVNIPTYATGGKDPLMDVESRLVFKYNWEDPQESVKTFEDVGVMSLGDLADVTGPVVKAAPEIAYALASRGGSSVMGTFGKLFGISAGTHLAEEGIEEMRGFNRQTLSQVLGDAFVQGTLAGVTGGGGKVGVETANILGGRGFKLSPEESRLLIQFNMLKKQGVPFEDITAAQGAPNSAILQRLQAQSEASSRFLKEKLIRQQSAASTALEDLPSIKASSYKISEGLKKLASAQYGKAKTMFETQFKATEPRAAGKGLQETFTKWVGDSKQQVSTAYGDVDRLVNSSPTPLVFDLKPAMEKVGEIENAVLADVRGTSIPGSIVDEMGNPLGKILVDGKPVNVADTPTGDLLRVVNQVKQLAQEQPNYETVKQLRTQVGEMIENWPWETSYNKGAAKRLYGTLTDVLMNPVGEVAAAYKPLMARASEMAKARFDVLDKPTIRTIIKADNPGKLAVRFGNPLEMTDEVMDVLNKYPEKKDQFRKYVHQNILFHKGGAINALEEWNRKDPVGLNYLFNTASGKKAFFEMADNWDRLNRSNLKKIVDADNASSSLANDIMDGRIPREQLGTLLRDLGGAKSEGHQLLQSSLLRRVIDKSIKTDPSTKISIVDVKALDKEIRSLKDSGAYALLDKSQREKLEGIDAYVALISPKGKDAGTSLETASMISGVKHPTTFLKSVHGLTVNEVIARLISSKAVTKAVLGEGKKRFEGKEFIATLLLTKAFMDKEAGAGGLPIAAGEQIK